MKKIQLQLTPRQLNTLVYLFTYVNRVYPKTRAEKVMRSILDRLMIKIKKKHVEVEATVHTLFTKKDKKYTFTFEYHEADCLEQYLLIADDFPLNDYDQNAVLFMKNKLNQQLA